MLCVFIGFSSVILCVVCHKQKEHEKHASVLCGVDLMRSRHLSICVIVVVSIIDTDHAHSLLHGIHSSHVTCHMLFAIHNRTKLCQKMKYVAFFGTLRALIIAVVFFR